MSDPRERSLLVLAAAALLPHCRDEGGHWDHAQAIRQARVLIALAGAKEDEAASPRDPSSSALGPPALGPGAAALGPAPPKRGPGRPRKDAGAGDFYAALNPRLRGSFDRVWAAYRLPKGKQDAAQVWLLLAPEDGLAERILAAAAADARGASATGETRSDGTARKWLQGWLTARRWEDAPGAARPGPDPARAAAIQRASEATGLRRQIARLTDARLPVPVELRAQLAALESEGPRAGGPRAKEEGAMSSAGSSSSALGPRPSALPQ